MTNELRLRQALRVRVSAESFLEEEGVKRRYASARDMMQAR